MHISFAVWNLQCNFKMLSKIFKDDIYVTFEIWLYVAFIQTASYVPFCTYYAHYVYSVIRILICEPGHSKTYAITIACFEDMDQPAHLTVEPGRQSALCWTLYLKRCICYMNVKNSHECVTCLQVWHIRTVNFEILKGKNFFTNV